MQDSIDPNPVLDMHKRMVELCHETGKDIPEIIQDEAEFPTSLVIAALATMTFQVGDAIMKGIPPGGTEISRPHPLMPSFVRVSEVAARELERRLGMPEDEMFHPLRLSLGWAASRAVVERDAHLHPSSPNPGETVH